jgi:predicted lipoprotein with Yx(FWY)xxD motif
MISLQSCERSEHVSQHTHRLPDRRGGRAARRVNCHRLWQQQQQQHDHGARPSDISERPPATVGVANNSNLGKILVDSQGRTLYLFQREMGKTSACTGACAAAWPPVRAAGTPVVGTGLSASKVGTTARTDGKPQVTYNGHPLYLYSADMKAGDANGQGVTAFGGGWFALSAAGSMVSGAGSTSGSANGY